MKRRPCKHPPVRPAAWLLPLLLLPATAMAAQPMELEGTRIIGEQELPQVEFRLPWQTFPEEVPDQRPWHSRLPATVPFLHRDYFRQYLRFKRNRSAPAPSEGSGTSTARP